jgi:hypothetical protein
LLTYRMGRAGVARRECPRHDPSPCHAVQQLNGSKRLFTDAWILPRSRSHDEQPDRRRVAGQTDNPETAELTDLDVRGGRPDRLMAKAKPKSGNRIRGHLELIEQAGIARPELAEQSRPGQPHVAGALARVRSG